MYFFRTALRVLQLDGRVYGELQEKGMAFRYSQFNFIITAAIYSFSAIMFLPYVTEGLNPAELFILQGMVLGTGIFVVFLFYLTVSILLWAFSKGLGAELHFSRIYTNLGLALVPLWVAMPGMAAISAGIENYPLYAVTALASAYLLPTAFVATKDASGLSVGRQSASFVILLVFLVSFVYLWVET